MQDQEVIKAFSPDAAQKALTDGICSWSLIRRSKHFDATGCCHTCKTRPAFAIVIPNQIPGSFPIRSRLSQLLGHPAIGRRSCHPHVDDLARLQFDDEEGKERTEEEIGDLQEITRPNTFRMIAQKGRPGLSSWSRETSLPHVLLDGSLAHMYAQLE